MHWGHVIAEKTWRLYQRKSAFWDLTMWQTLIRSRLNCGAGPDEMCIDDHDLIDMATRLDLLKQAENRLNARFVALKEQKKQAVEDRKTIKTKLSNIHAAHSLQTSQATGHKLTDNPVYQSLKTYVNWLTLPLRRSTDEERKFHENYKEVIRMTQNTLTYCRNLALANFDEQGVTEPHSQEALTKLKEDLVHIDKLHADMETSIVKIFRKTMPLPNPVIRREIVQR